MTSTLYHGSEAATVIAEVTGRMGIVNGIGAQADAEPGSPARVVWVPATEPDMEPQTYEPAIYQREEGVVMAYSSEPFWVHVWGDDYSACMSLRDRLFSTLESFMSMNRVGGRSGAYRIGRGEAWGGNLATRGFGLRVLITLILPIYAERYEPDFDIEDFHQVGTAVDTSGSEQEIVNDG